MSHALCPQLPLGTWLKAQFHPDREGFNVRRLLAIALGSALFFSACGSSSGTAAPVPTPTPTPTPTATPTPTPTASPTVKITIAPTPTSPDADWIVWAPTGSGFTSMFPAEPKLTTATTKTAAGNAPSSTWTYLESTELALYVTLVKYPKGSLTGQAPSAIFDAFINGIAAASKGVAVDSKTATTMGGHAASSFKMSSTSAGIEGEVVIVGDNLYVVYAAYLLTLTDTSPVDAFIADFALTV